MAGPAELSDVMHEINTPLSVAVSHAQLARRQAAQRGDAELEQRLDRIIRSVQQASCTLRDLYDHLIPQQSGQGTDGCVASGEPFIVVVSASMTADAAPAMFAGACLPGHASGDLGETIGFEPRLTEVRAGESDDRRDQWWGGFSAFSTPQSELK